MIKPIKWLSLNLQSSQREVCLKNPEIEIIPLPLRLVKHGVSGVTYLLGTTLIDQQWYTVEALAELYFSRWGIEELYKISKNLMEVEDFHGKTQRGVKQELFAHFILITMSRIFANEIDGDFMQTKKSTEEPFKVNMKSCLISVASNLESLLLQQITLVKKTVNKIIGFVANCRQKERPNRSYERRSRKPLKKWYKNKNKTNGRPAAA